MKSNFKHIAILVLIKIPAVAYIVTIATIFTIPGVPFSDVVSTHTANVDFLSL